MGIFKLNVPTAITFSFLSSAVFADSAIWNDGEMSFVEFNCEEQDVSEIIVSGIVTISRSDDVDFRKPPRTIKISCPRIEFRQGAELRTPNELLVAVDTLAGDLIVFRSTRGLSGEDALPTPQLWQQLIAPDGVHGINGNPNGAKTSGGALGVCRDGRDGGHGARGTNGHNGQHGQKGASGNVGYSGARITIGVGEFETGEETLEIYSRGGQGGSGGKGGRGQDGGRGGDGGHAGRGGDAECFHRGANGGNGGDGGDGGRGGNGGPGGDGGNGGSGGDITFGLVEGGQRPKQFGLYTEGGAGGLPGLGGDLGLGGDYGIGGRRGDKGKGWFEDGSSGNDGQDGQRGQNGEQGPLGEPGLKGPDGAQGGTGTWQDGPITPSILQELKNISV